MATTQRMRLFYCTICMSDVWLMADSPDTPRCDLGCNSAVDLAEYDPVTKQLISQHPFSRISNPKFRATAPAADSQ